MEITEEIQNRQELQISRVPTEMPHEFDDLGKHDPKKQHHKRGEHARDVRLWLRCSNGVVEGIAQK